jgi:isopentenyl-diphosphate delta-isomerase
VESDLEKIYVVDESNLPLAVMASEQAHLQGLRHRGFLLLLTDAHGRLVLRRLDKNHPRDPGRWDIIGSGHVTAGQAAEETAEQHLPPAAAGLAGNLLHLRTLDTGAGTGREIVEVFCAQIPDQVAGLLLQDRAFLAVDHDELTALTSSYADQLSAALLATWNFRLYPVAAS